MASAQLITESRRVLIDFDQIISWMGSRLREA
jgi:hypothetical protein